MTPSTAEFSQLVINQTVIDPTLERVQPGRSLLGIDIENDSRRKEKGEGRGPYGR